MVWRHVNKVVLTSTYNQVPLADCSILNMCYHKLTSSLSQSLAANIDSMNKNKRKTFLLICQHNIISHPSGLPSTTHLTIIRVTCFSGEFPWSSHQSMFIYIQKQRLIKEKHERFMWRLVLLFVIGYFGLKEFVHKYMIFSPLNTRSYGRVNFSQNKCSYFFTC